MKLVLMKYLNSKNMPCYRRMTEETTPGSDEDRLEMMELEAKEMLYSGDMKKLLWIKCLDKEEYKNLIDSEAKARLKVLDGLIETWDSV